MPINVKYAIIVLVSMQYTPRHTKKGVLIMEWTRRVKCEALGSFCLKKTEVDPGLIVMEARALYEAVKIVGYKNVTIKIDNHYVKITDNAVIKLVAFAGQVNRLMERWTDDNMMRLEAHLGLPTHIRNILSDMDMFKKQTVSLEIISIYDLMEDYKRNYW